MCVGLVWFANLFGPSAKDISDSTIISVRRRVEFTHALMVGMYWLRVMSLDTCAVFGNNLRWMSKLRIFEDEACPLTNPTVMPATVVAISSKKQAISTLLSGSSVRWRSHREKLSLSSEIFPDLPSRSAKVVLLVSLNNAKNLLPVSAHLALSEPSNGVPKNAILLYISNMDHFWRGSTFTVLYSLQPYAYEGGGHSAPWLEPTWKISAKVASHGFETHVRAN